VVKKVVVEVTMLVKDITVRLVTGTMTVGQIVVSVRVIVLV
jgi:hypothetical protein